MNLKLMGHYNSVEKLPRMDYFSLYINASYVLCMIKIKNKLNSSEVYCEHNYRVSDLAKILKGALKIESYACHESYACQSQKYKAILSFHGIQ